MSNRDVAREMRNSFPHFAIKAFNLVNPGSHLNPTEAFLAISHKLAEVEAGRIRRLIINVPPRSGKSLLASQRIIAESGKHRATNLIEDAASGTILLQDLHQHVRCIARRPFGDKLTRFQSASVHIEAGGVYLPAGAEWLNAFKREVLPFPRGPNDDQVDALSQLVNWAFDKVRSMPLQTSSLK